MDILAQEREHMKNHITVRLNQKFGVCTSILERDAEQAAEEYLHENYSEHEDTETTKNWYIEMYMEMFNDKHTEHVDRYTQDELLKNVPDLRRWINEYSIVNSHEVTDADIIHFLKHGTTQ